MKRFWNSFVKAGFNTFIHHDGVEHAGYLAFLGLLSFFPFLVLFVAIAGWLGETQLTGELAREIQSLLPDRVMVALKPRMDEILAGPPQGLVALAFFGIIWTASATLEGARTALNRAYRVATPPSYLWRRLRSIFEFAALTVLVFIAMIIFIFFPLLWQSVDNVINPEFYTHLNYLITQYGLVIRYGFAGGTLLLGITLSYYVLPNIRQRLSCVLPGAIVVLIMWLLAAELFTLYLQNFNLVNIVYGSLGGVIVTLLFFYILAFIYIFGAEFNYFFSKKGHHKDK